MKTLFNELKYDMGLSNLMNILPNPDRILRTNLGRYQVLRDLKNDPHVWSCIQSRKSGLMSLEWALIQNESSEGIYRIISEFLKKIDVFALTRDILEAPLFGFQPFEIIWKLSEDKQKIILPERIIPRLQELFIFDKNGNIKLSNSMINNEELSAYKILVAGYEANSINPYGHSLLSKCFYPVTFKNGGLKIWLNFIEKFGSPLIMGQYQRGTTQDEIEKFADSLNLMAQDAVIVAPSDINVEFKEAAKSTSSELFRDLLKFCNTEISKAILSQTLTTEIDIGSYAATEIHFRIRKEVILSDARLVETFINKIIKMIFELNFPNEKMPIFNLIINDAENTQRIERDIKITQMGFAFSKEYVANSYGFKSGDLESHLVN
jgi:phage gp29-like protein